MLELTKSLSRPQILVLGKLMQPALLSWAAYRDQDVFRQRSGMEKSLLISEPRTGTQVRALLPSPTQQTAQSRAALLVLGFARAIPPEVLMLHCRTTCVEQSHEP